jgi:hypothetical protein
VIVNDSTNFNKMNNHLSHQLIELKKKKTTTHEVGAGPGFGTGTKIWWG